MNFSLKKLTNYCLDHSTPPVDLLNNLDRETHLKTLAPQMIAGPLQGQLLRFLSLMIQPDRVLEIGTFTGYATLCLAAGLKPKGKLITVEANEELEYLAQKYIKQSDQASQIEQIIGDAKSIIPTLEGPFDLVFIDAGKMDYALYYNLVFEKVRPGGFLIADNVLWSGKVTQQEHDRDTQILHAFNEKIQQDPRVENLMLPIRDGILLIRKL